MIVIESTGRKLKDAIDNGLAQLGKSLAEVDVEVLDNGGLFRKAKVRITVQGEEPVVAPEPKVQPKPVAPAQPEQKEAKRQEKRERPMREKPEHKEHTPAKKEQEQAPAKRENKERSNKLNAVKESKAVAKELKAPAKEERVEKKEPRRYEPVTLEVAKKAEDFVTELIAKMGVSAAVETSIEEGELHINLKAEASTLIGYHGEVLDSIEYMTSYVINREGDKFYHIIVNCNNYREKRKESLIALANKMAAKCIKVRHKIVLEPMNSTERKIIHSALADNDKIITRSEGHEPNRHIVILCKRR